MLPSPAHLLKFLFEPVSAVNIDTAIIKRGLLEELESLRSDSRVNQKEEDKQSRHYEAASLFCFLPNSYAPEKDDKKSPSNWKKEVDQRVNVDSIDKTTELFLEEAIK